MKNNPSSPTTQSNKETRNKKLMRYWVHKVLKVGAFYNPFVGFHESPKLFKQVLQELIDNPKMKNGYLSDEYMYGFKTKGKHGASS